MLAVRFGAADRAPARVAQRALPARCTDPTLAITGMLYTIPSLALFALLAPAHRLVAHDRADPARRVHAADPRAEHRDRPRRRARRREGRRRRAWGTRGRGASSRVELPLAMPAIIAGVRIATVTHDRPRHRHRAHRPGRARAAAPRRLPARLPDAAHRRHRAVARRSRSSPTCCCSARSTLWRRRGDGRDAA